MALLGCAVAFHVGAQDAKGRLVLYTSQPERDAAQTVAAFKRVHPGIDVEVFRSGTTEVMGKLADSFFTADDIPAWADAPRRSQRAGNV